jgi:polysaccharide pyruvyl transferase WcaK-like protein
MGMKRVAVFNDTSGGRHFGCVAVMTNLVTLLRRNNMDPQFFWPVGVDWRLHKEKIVKHLDEVDAIIVNGEGTIHNDMTRTRAASLLELGKFCRHELNKPCFLVNATLHNISEEGVSLLSEFDQIFVRDSNSETFLRTRGISTVRTFDLSLFGLIGKNYKPHKGTMDSTPLKILFTGSVVSATDVELKDLSLKLAGTFQDVTAPIKMPQKIINKIRRLLHISNSEGRKTLRYKNDHEQWLEKITSYDLLVCGRFHAATLCTGTFTPFVALESNTPKVSCFLNDVFGNMNRLFSTAQIAEAVRKKENLNFTQEETQSIIAYLKFGEQTCETMMNEIYHAIRA